MLSLSSLLPLKIYLSSGIEMTPVGKISLARRINGEKWVSRGGLKTALKSSNDSARHADRPLRRLSGILTATLNVSPNDLRKSRIHPGDREFLPVFLRDAIPGRRNDKSGYDHNNSARRHQARVLLSRRARMTKFCLVAEILRAGMQQEATAKSTDLGRV